MAHSVDNLVINNMELATSGDQNNARDLTGRAAVELANMLAGGTPMLVKPVSPGADIVGVAEYRDFCWGFGVDEIVGAGPAQLMLHPGALKTTRGAETPTTYDSLAKLALEPATSAIDIPVADDNWHLLEARVVLEEIEESRQILTNPLTDDYTATDVVKFNTMRVEWRWVVGTGTDLPAPDPDWVPMYGLFNPMLGTGPIIANMVDCRPLYIRRAHSSYDGFNGALTKERLVTSYAMSTESVVNTGTGDVTNSWKCQFKFAAKVDGFDLWASSAGDNVTPPFTDLRRWLGGATGAGGVLPSPAADTWYYIYLGIPTRGPVANSQWGDNYLGVPTVHGASVAGNAPLYILPDPPAFSDGTLALVPSSDPASPLAAYGISKGICVGVIKSNAAGSGWVPMGVSAGGSGMINSNWVAAGTSNVVKIPYATLNVAARSVAVATPAGFLPVGMVRNLKCGIAMSLKNPLAAAVPGRLAVYVGSAAAASFAFDNFFGIPIQVDPDIQADWRLTEVQALDTTLARSLSTLNIRVESRTDEGQATILNLDQVVASGCELAVRMVGFDLA